MVDISFPKFFIFAWKLKFYQWQQILSDLWIFFSLEVADSLQENIYKVPSLTNHSLSVSWPFKSEWHSLKKAATWTLKSNNCTRVFPQDNTWYFTIWKCFMHIPRFILQNIFKSIPKGHLIKLISLTASSRTFLNEIGIFSFNCECISMKKVTTSTVFLSLLDLYWDTSTFTHHYFCAISINVNPVKRANGVFVLLWK